MTEKEITKLTRKELIRMLIAVTEENDSLREENEKLSKELKTRKISIENSGTMAEAALKLNRVFEAADAAAKQYLQNVKAKADAESRAAAKAAKKASEEKPEEKPEDSIQDVIPDADGDADKKEESAPEKAENTENSEKPKKSKGKKV